ncbi:MAG: hypothetical protein ISS16_09495 [Ignavibacteria bacterium]|nr:hypothetical protein [Ignavibacteria bacterium]
MSNKCEICGRELLPEGVCSYCNSDELNPKEKIIEKVAIGFCFLTLLGIFMKIVVF